MTSVCDKLSVLTFKELLVPSQLISMDNFPLRENVEHVEYAHHNVARVIDAATSRIILRDK